MSGSTRKAALWCAVLGLSSHAALAWGDAYFANQVVSYDPGDLTNNFWTDPGGALGKPVADTGSGVLTPFNGAFDASQITGIGAGGSLTLKLPQTAGAVGHSIAIHAAVGIIDNDWPNGDPGATATPYTNPRASNVEVSYDGVNWVDAGMHAFTSPTNYYAQGVTTPGYQDPATVTSGVEADWSKPFLQGLSSFDGSTWNGMLATLDGSAGGDWIDFDALPLAGINYVRFSVPAGTTYPMIVDAVGGTTENQANSATRNITTSPIVESSAGTIFTNSGTVTTSGATTVMGATPNAASAFINSGTVTTSTADPLSFSVPFQSAGGTIEALAGDITLNGRFITTAGTTMKLGNAALVINGPQYHASGSSFVAAAGTTRFNTDARGLSVVAQARVELNAGQNLEALSVQPTGTVIAAAGGGATIYVNELSIAAGGKLDLNDNDLVVNAGSFSAVQALVFAGYRQSADPSASGIISSTGQTSAGNPILALFDNAFIGAADYPFGSGHTISPGAVVGKYTYFGDTNFDGMVTADDYGALDANFGAIDVPAGEAWLLGDENFDGKVTADDYGTLDANFGMGVGTPLAANGKAVPEPGTVSLVVLGMAEVVRRRKRGRG